ncbi:hypothetical protein DCCM_4604 [Desulfocucumis palustris]|uniref:NusG-like N-terminal domain-containing protein n=1 Tax=Desulfocucumis palustris TaxID=1898651 RepID=A0A2L2XGZ0_9FIRM|nr:transcription termination/antitermination NusG family protein [Desulfocucumis palustris]GBF35475.1 hypothetical protein DCCM_4604 [Desulfocucumis palustris]
MAYNWIALQVHSGKEIDVEWSVKFDLKGMENLGRLIDKAVAPLKKIAVFSSKKVMYEPIITGYVFVKCILTDQLWHYLRRLPHVYGILNGTISEEEMERILSRCENQAEFDKPDTSILESIKAKFSRIIEAKRNKKSVIRLPLQYVRNLMKSAQVFFVESYSEKMLIRLMMEPVELAL